MPNDNETTDSRIRTVTGKSLWIMVFFAAMICLTCQMSHARSRTDQDADASRLVRKNQNATQWARVFLLQDYNTRIVIFGVGVLGAAAGLVGSFTLLRKRALMGDALSHASLPGIAIAYILATTFGADGKSMPILLCGATLSGLVGVVVILIIRNQTRLKEDAALGIVLSVFFGLGVALLAIVQQMSGHAAGLESFIYGKTASMRAADAQMIAMASTIAIASCLLLFKEFELLCFDEGFAGSRGFPVVLLDIVLMSLVILVTIVGLQAVGLILMIALMVIPAAAARFWTESMWNMMVWAAGLGLVSSVGGGLVSALYPGLPSGAMIVLVCSLFFFISMIGGTHRGVLIRQLRRVRLNRRIDRQHLLRAMFEQIERNVGLGHVQFGDADSPERLEGPTGAAIQKHRRTPISIDELLSMRSWSVRRLKTAIARAEDDELLRLRETQCVLTQAGFAEAARLTRQHRLWEMYLIAYAEVATANVDRDADDIEHVLAPDVIDQLEDLLDEQAMSIPVPRSPHTDDQAAAPPHPPATGEAL